MAAFLGRTTPILRVADINGALRFYSDALGFHTHWGDSLFASIGRDEAVLMLTAGDQGAGRAWVYIGLADVDALHTELMRVKRRSVVQAFMVYFFRFLKNLSSWAAASL